MLKVNSHSAILPRLFKNHRIGVMILFIVFSLIGTAMMFGIEKSHAPARLVGFCFTTAYVANFPLAISVATSNFQGFTKKTSVLAMVFIAYCVGNIAGPQFFLSSEAPKYPVCAAAIKHSFEILKKEKQMHASLTLSRLG